MTPEESKLPAMSSTHAEMNMEVKPLKLCPVCKVEKPPEGFHSDRCRKDGRASICRECRSAYEFRRPRAASTIQKAQERAANRVFDKKKVNAKNTLGAAVKAGRVQKWPACAVPECVRTEVEAHHPDYDRPLDVTWLCRMHHRLAHNLIRLFASTQAEKPVGQGGQS